ncbi:MAG: dihydroorotase [Alphaproteobacteria bacterium]|nr:dihydroorotase [Alphaproteobacteria bacterium]
MDNFLNTLKDGQPIALLNARILDPESGMDTQGGILIKDDLIIDIGYHIHDEALNKDFFKLNCNNYCVAPGFIDLRVQLCEPGYTHKETIATAGKAAAAGGITSLVCLPNTNPVIDDVSVLEFITKRAQQTTSPKVYCYGAITKGLLGKDLSEMGLLAESGAIAFTDGLMAVDDPTVMRRALSYSSAFDLLIVQHPEDYRLAFSGCVNEGELATRLGLPAIPSCAEVMQIERDLQLVTLTNSRYHVAHISTAAAVEAIKKAKEQGLRVTCDTAPPYFSLNEYEIGDYRTFTKLSPPLRQEKDRKAIVQGLIDGIIDCIASDHTPQDQESKRLPFNQAAFGIVGLETLFTLSLELYHKGEIPLLNLLAKITSNPANLLKLPQGRIAKNAPADLVLFDLEKPNKISVDKFLSKSKNSPFDGRLVQGHILYTFANGRLIYNWEKSDVGFIS